MITAFGRKLFCTLVSAILLVAGASGVKAQGVVWSTNYGGIYNEQGHSACSLPDGGYAVLGATYSFGDGDHDIYLLRLNSFGDTIWTRHYGGAAADYGFDIQPAAGNGFVIVGVTQSYGLGKGDVYLIRLDSLGELLWSRTYGGTELDEGHSVRQTGDGGYIICGTTNSSGAGYADLYLVKTDANGNVQWTRTYGGAGGESGSAVRVTAQGGYIAVGSTGSFGEGYSSLYVVRTDAAGDSLWAAAYGGSKADFGYSVEGTSDDGYVFVGASASFGLGYTDAYLLKTDADGFVQWQEAYGGAKDDRAYAVRCTADGGYILAGTTESFGNGKIDCYVVRTDPAGVPVWTQTYGGRYSDFCRNLVTQTGSFCLIGYSYSYTAGGSDIYVLKAYADQMTAVPEDDEPPLPAGLRLAQNYPNPFNLSTTIEFAVSNRSPARLTIFNVLGRKVAEWVFASVPAGTSSVVWDGCNASGNVVTSGVYFYRLVTGTAVQTKKMVLIK